MKLLVCISLFAVIVAFAVGSPAVQGANNANVQVKPDKDNNDQESFQSLNPQLNGDMNRYRKAIYGSAAGAVNIPVPACAKNYLFSCQPNLSPVPCGSPASHAHIQSHSHAGAYTAPVPAYVAPLGNGYDGFVPQSMGQFYQY